MTSRAEFEKLASALYGESQGYDSITESLFALLVDVADTYLWHLENNMPVPDLDRPETFGSPYFAGAMPIEVVINGLFENLEMRQDGQVPRLEGGDPS